eukprot:TRINITY_DN3926_c0_g1_i1.p1 TRINITY_DN3926_c0_g1~~TRINITY_DN3926_c0_g1_i1.p1  ORF type:complete len:314 (+),score=29.80 TRINITY_DN3926_c0_g1_i1:94-1035(+)
MKKKIIHIFSVPFDVVADLVQENALGLTCRRYWQMLRLRYVTLCQRHLQLQPMSLPTFQHILSFSPKTITLLLDWTAAENFTTKNPNSKEEGSTPPTRRTTYSSWIAPANYVEYCNVLNMCCPSTHSLRISYHPHIFAAIATPACSPKCTTSDNCCTTGGDEKPNNMTLVSTEEEGHIANKKQQTKCGLLVKSPQLETLEIDASFLGLGDALATKLFQSLEGATNLKHLHLQLAGNRLLGACITDLLKALQTLESLQYLEIDFAHNYLRDVDQFCCLANNKNLKQVQLGFAYNFRLNTSSLEAFRSSLGELLL